MESPREERDSVERAFFDAYPWNTLEKDRVGVSALKNYLGQLIYDRIRNDIPSIEAEMQQNIKTLKEKLHQLGKPRSSEAEQRRYIVAVGVAAHAIAEDAFHGRYEKQIFVSTEALKLRQHARGLNKRLADAYVSYGNTYAFSSTLTSRAGEEGEGGTYHHGVFRRHVNEHDIIDWISSREAESRGPELPNLTSASIYPQLFSELTANWQHIADFYFGELRATIRKFHSSVMDSACHDPFVRQKISKLHREKLDFILSDAEKELTEMIDAERTSILLTENPDYLRLVEKFRDGRLMATLDSVTAHPESGNTTPPETNAVRNQVLRNVRASINANLSNDKIIKIHDSLRAYYRIARRRIVDGIIIQVFERKVLRRILDLYDPGWAGGLTPEELELLASEPAVKAQERQYATEDLKLLEDALQTLA
ncbi:hypothetical protein ABW19_dt0202817 [Dactylella cylindrospora]|nr:hypothetical protein ABW19_dt0202817 [Dactylella cylindrospora]